MRRPGLEFPNASPKHFPDQQLGRLLFASSNAIEHKELLAIRLPALIRLLNNNHFINLTITFYTLLNV